MLYTFIYIVLSVSEPVNVEVIAEESNLTHQECEQRRTESLSIPREFNADIHIPLCKIQGENNE